MADQPDHGVDGSQNAPQQAPFGDALLEVVKHLKDDPLLLFGIGAAIVVVGLGVWGPEGIRALTWPVLVVLLAALGASVFLKAGSLRQQMPQGGNVRVARNARIHAGRDLITSAHDGKAGDLDVKGDLSAGRDIDAGARHN